MRRRSSLSVWKIRLPYGQAIKPDLTLYRMAYTLHLMQVFPEPIEFEWDTGNSGKNLRLHEVADGECEEVFFDTAKKILNDVLHSGTERRYIILGSTREYRKLFVVCTIRGRKVRIISARDLNAKEKRLLQ